MSGSVESAVKYGIIKRIIYTIRRPVRVLKTKNAKGLKKKLVNQ